MTGQDEMTVAQLVEEAARLDALAASFRERAQIQRLANGRKTPIGQRLVYAAQARCPCGAGMAYDPFGASGGYPERGENESVFKGVFSGYWECSAILLGEAVPSGEPGAVKHEAQLPFNFYEIKSEKQHSAGGATTRHKAAA